MAREHAGTDCLFVYHKSWHMQSAYCEAREYNSVTFLKEENLEILGTMDLASRYELIVILDGRDQDILNQIMDICPYLNTYEHLGGFGANNTYYLYAGQDALAEKDAQTALNRAVDLCIETVLADWTQKSDIRVSIPDESGYVIKVSAKRSTDEEATAYQEYNY